MRPLPRPGPELASASVRLNGETASESLQGMRGERERAGSRQDKTRQRHSVGVSAVFQKWKRQEDTDNKEKDKGKRTEKEEEKGGRRREKTEGG